MSHQVAVVGCGYWGPNLVRNFVHTPGVEKVYCCDKDEKRVEQLRENLSEVFAAGSFEEILADSRIDIVALATPVPIHYELAKAALNAGKHVLVEKPFTNSSEQARELIELAEAKGKIIMVDHTFLFTGAVRKIKDVIDKDELGDLMYYDSSRINLGLFRDVNVLWDLATHDISIIDYIFKSKPVAVACTGHKYVKYKHESSAYLTIFFDDSSIAHINVSWVSPVKIRMTLIGGSKKMLVYDDIQASEKVKIYDKSVVISDDPEEIYSSRVQYRVGDIFTPVLDDTEALALECSYLLECIDGGVKPFNDGESGLRVVKIIEAAVQSIEKGGQSVKIES